MRANPTLVNGNRVHPLSENAYRIFEEKGIINSVKVRRIMQIARDVYRDDLSHASILDLGCAEGVHSIEAGLQGANVLGIDGRKERMEWGQSIVDELNLTKVKFLQQDVRKLSRKTHGDFDIIYLLGLLYHLDVPSLFEVLSNVYDMCRDFVIIDTQFSFESYLEVSYKGVTYHGKKSRRHGDNDSSQVIQARLAGSLDNIFCFIPTKDSLLRLLYNIGFTTAFQCFMPPQPHLPKNRITLVAIKGTKGKISSYPWINDSSEKQIADRLKKAGPWKNPWWTPVDGTKHSGWMISLEKIIRRHVRKLGYDIKKLSE